MTIVKSITKSIDIDVDINHVFEFISNPLNWPKWAVINLRSITRGGDGWYDIESRQGKGQIKMLTDKSHGILDHLWKDPQASWTVPARVIQNHTGCTFIMSFLQPPVMNDTLFKTATDEMDIELITLKNILESLHG